jgi:threonylcarbamoyladenosine tRNA methylthiotransferase MtaB
MPETQAVGDGAAGLAAFPFQKSNYLLGYNTTVSSFYVENFGCRATQADGAALERQLIEQGLQRAEIAAQAQVVVLNTCTVTASADHDVRAAIRRIHRENPGCRILVTGCYAQRAPQEIAALEGVACVVGNSHKHQVAQIARSSVAPLNVRPDRGTAPAAADFVAVHELSPPTILVGDIFAHTELLAAPVFDADTRSEKTRPNLKVQDGCDNRCSFCIIPQVRGHSRSLKLDHVLREVDGLVACGYREIVISGINLGRWGRDLDPPQRFEQLVRAIVEQTPLEKLRISSVEPMDWSDELIELVASSGRIAKHAHVPMQSMSDRMLRRMHRKYRPWHYADKLHKIRAAMPNAAIGADVMVGFPGETDLDFEETRCAITQLPLTYLHVFTYSSRPGTPSAAMPAQVPGQVARERNRILRELAAGKKLSFQQSFIGTRLDAITLSVYHGEHTEALTDNYQKLLLPGFHEANRWVSAQILDVVDGAMIGAKPDI